MKAKFKQRLILALTTVTGSLALLGYMMIRAALQHFDNYISRIMFTSGILFILLFIAVLIFLFHISKKEIRKNEFEKIQETFNLIENGTKIPINLDTIRITKLNLAGKESGTLRSMLEFEVAISGKNRDFRMFSHNQPETLEMYFALQKQTSLYVNPYHSEEFYLDLSFVN